MNGNPQSAPPASQPGFREEFRQCWEKLPNKTLFFVLLVAWLALFQLYGNCTFGYIATPSLLRWMFNAYWGANYTPAEHPYTGPGAGIWDDIRPFWNGGLSDDGHGLIIPIVVLALMWWKRKELLAQTIRAWPPAFLLLAIALVLHVAGYMVQQQRVSIVAMFVGIYALMGLAWGPGWLRANLFPFFLFAFCVPSAALLQPLTFPLRVMVCKMVVAISPVLGFDVVREGTALSNFQHSYQYDVAPACSGLRSLVAICSLATIYAFCSFKRVWKRVVVILSAVPLAIVSNVIRMLCIIVAAEVGGQHEGDFVHENWFFSLVPYVPAMLGVMLIGYWLREPEPERAIRIEPKPKPA
jgi:exosortase